jgi:uncharacterized membrane protein
MGVSGRREGNGFANALGWLSVGLGLAQVVAPRRMARLVGVSDDDRNRTLLRTVGMREIASGVGILARPRPAGWVWTRVAGDVMDLTLLGRALASGGTQRQKASAATAAVLGIAALDVLCAQQLSRGVGATTEGAVHLQRSITINRPPDEAYRFWRDLRNLPRFMSRIESVQVTGERQAHIRARTPMGAIEWDAEIVDDRPNELIKWRTIRGAEGRAAGSVHFKPGPGGRGTEITLELQFRPPGGAMGARLAQLFHEIPEMQIENNLRRFKQLLEVGEVVVSDATVRRGPHPAQPSEAPARA